MSDLKEELKDPSIEQMSSSSSFACLSMSFMLCCLLIILAFVGFAMTASVAKNPELVKAGLAMTPQGRAMAAAQMASQMGSQGFDPR
jgi:hypothetical protein